MRLSSAFRALFFVANLESILGETVPSEGDHSILRGGQNTDIASSSKRTVSFSILKSLLMMNVYA